MVLVFWICFIFIFIFALISQNHSKIIFHEICKLNLGWWVQKSRFYSLSIFLGPLHCRNTQSWIEFWNSTFQKKKKKKKKICANKSRFYCFYVKKKAICGLLSIYIFSRLTYTVKDEINSQVAFPQKLKKYSLTLYAE